MRRSVSRILLFSVLHFMIAMLIAVLAFGVDLDQLRSRSPLSRAAANVHDVLWWPHDHALRALPHDWIAHHTYFIPIALVLNSLVWGTAIYVVAIAIDKLRRT
ncbi:MAG TPA: hypothetical protein VF042_16660 [Gemmatimonadaceae bacterium]